MAEFASRGVANTALGLSIGSVAAELLGGTIGNIFNGTGSGNGGCSDNAVVNRYEMNLQKELTNKDMEIAYLRGRDAAKSDDLETYKYVDGRFRVIEGQIAQQAVINAQIQANLACQQQSIMTLQGMTKTIIPIDNVCPQPMQQFNSWVAPSTTGTT